MKSLLRISLFFSIFSCDTGKIDLTEYRIPGPRDSYRIMFWNVENLFDTSNDTLKEDDEYLPYGIRNWTKERYQKKLINLYKVILAAGDEKPPEIIGLCEVENQRVLFDLLRNTPMDHFKYRFVHHDSPDLRGIDVAMLYDPAVVNITEESAIPVDLAAEGGSRTRDILCIRSALNCKDTMTIFINHWPSKYGGAGRTEDFRKIAAKTLKTHVEALMKRRPAEKILIMGDFNDPPDASSILVHLGSEKPGELAKETNLYNLSGCQQKSVYGTYKYMGIWELLDQIMVNGNLLKARLGLFTSPANFRIFSPSFLLERDETFGGNKPYRTFSGMDYRPGFSDHLPVYIDLEFKRNP